MRKKRSLGQSCILCSTAHDVLNGGTTSKTASRASSPGRLPSYNGSERVEDAGDFVLGDDSDEEKDDLSNANPPPRPVAGDWGEPPAYDEHVDEKTVEADEKKAVRVQPSIHYIRPEETLLGLSMKYGVDGALLCRLNKLPTSTLSTTPHLLHTREFILLPPDARASISTEPVLPPELERKRLVVRRFMVATKCTDWSMAQTYVDQVFRAREDEARFVQENRAARGDTGADAQLREGGELWAAVEAYQADERWEREQRNLHGGVKGKGVFGRRTLDPGASGTKDSKGWSWK
ncbi:hypothetical protein JCM10295v2_002107 [Rhodotorula toruloides]